MKAVIAQADLVTAYGWGIQPLWDGLFSRTTAVISTPTFASAKPTNSPVAMVPGLVVQPGTSRVRAMLHQLVQPLIGKLDPQTALILATTLCEIEHVERAVFDRDPNAVAKADPTVLLKYLQQMLGLTGPVMVLSSACASSAAALSRAAAMVERGNHKAILVVTADAVSEFVYSGFSTLLSLCDTPAKPFDARRCGLSLGEAAAWALITPSDSPLADRNAITILGWSSTSDAIHITAPDRTAGGLTRAITAACRMADLSPDQVDFIAAHGTATLYNDAMELLAFAGALPKPVPIFSIKGGTGHTLAAAGLVQILVAGHAMRLRTVPPTVGMAEPDASAADWVHDTAVNLVGEPIALSTNSGFGGVNTAVVLGLNSSAKLKVPTEVAAPPVIAVSWIYRGTCGAWGAEGLAQSRSVSIDEPTAPIDAPVKYWSRMTREARACLVAANLAIKPAGWKQSPALSIAILGTGYTGCLAADYAYFQDYVAGGQSLGRANLFIYTLPTSALSELAIALNLTGPTLHVGSPADSVAAMIEQANSIVQSGEAGGALCLWSDGQSALCVAVGCGRSISELANFDLVESPSNICRRFAAMARES